MADHSVLVTGAAGAIGAMLRPRLRRPGRLLRLLDRVPVPPAEPGEAVQTVIGSVTDAASLDDACHQMDAVVHLAGIAVEDRWERILDVNIDGTHAVLEAARRQGVPRVVLASSNHAVGFRRLDEAGADGLPADSPPRPDTYYGVSKAAMEALGSLYHSRFGMDVLCLRIGDCSPRPSSRRALTNWLSPDDVGRLVEACLSAEHPGYRVVWGMSANTRGAYRLDEARALGYRPLDDAERHADELPAEPDSNPHVGGPFTDIPLGEPL